jgi:hypothetical protein
VAEIYELIRLNKKKRKMACTELDNNESVIQRRICTCLIITLIVFFLGCATDPEYFTVDDFKDVEKIDAHVHINAENTAFLEQAQTDNFRLLTINVDYPDFPPIEEQKRIALSNVHARSDLVAFCSTFRMNGWDEPQWQDRTIRFIDNTISEGAVAVKVWKNIGMEYRDQIGNLVMIDDPKFDFIFSHIHDTGITLIGHMGEPKDCWMPLEEMSVKYLKEYFTDHPQYHMYLHAEMPSYEDQMGARDRMLEKNMNINFVGAHLASLEWSVDELAQFLDKFPNATVDMAARISHLLYQTIGQRDKVRQFFLDYQDLVLYATDITQTADDDPVKFKEDVHKRWLTDWKYFNTDSIMTDPDLNEPFQGLALPKDVVEKIYSTNAKREFPAAWNKVETQ